MNLNPQSLNSKVSDIKASDLKASNSKVWEVSDTWVPKASNSRASEVSNKILSLGSFRLGSETRFRRLRAWELLGLWLSWASTWARGPLGLMKVDSWPNSYPPISLFEGLWKFLCSCRMDQTSEACSNSKMCTALEVCSSPRHSWKNEFQPCLGGKILNFERIIGGKNFEIFPPKFFWTRGSLETKLVIKCADSVVEAWPRVDQVVVVRPAVSCQS